MVKSYKYRIYPNKQQEKLIQKTFGCCRFVYNYYLNKTIELYKKEKKKYTYNQCCRDLTKLKSELLWLREVDSTALQSSLKNLDVAYQKFFNEYTGHPKFKTKKTHRYSYNSKNNHISKGGNIKYHNKYIKLPKLGMIKIRSKLIPQGKIVNATISQYPSGKYFISLCCVDIDTPPFKKTDNVIGIDLGIKDLLITSDGEKFDNIRTTKKYEDKLTKEQRRLAHKQKGSKNYEKQRIKVAKIYEKIHNTRIDYLHKISHKLISENQVIVSEDLAISNMMKNHNLAKAIQDCSWYELTRQLQYKADWNNRQYIKIDRFVKSSQICNVCGYINAKTKNLAVREWICPECGTVHDRDINAAINILNDGLRVLNTS